MVPSRSACCRDTRQQPVRKPRFGGDEEKLWSTPVIRAKRPFPHYESRPTVREGF